MYNLLNRSNVDDFYEIVQRTTRKLETPRLTFREAIICCILVLVPVFVNRAIVSTINKWSDTSIAAERGPRLPPVFPYTIPFLGSTIPLLLDTEGFIRTAGKYVGSLIPVRISTVFDDIFLIQGHENIKAIWRQPLFGSPIPLYLFSLKYMFGMPKEPLQAYLSDDSGPRAQPYEGSNVKPHNRIDYLSHGDMASAFSGTGLKTLLRRCITGLQRNLDSLDITEDEWTEMPDYGLFFHHQIGSAMVNSLFGPKLLDQSPEFLRDMWTFDKAIPKFWKMLPHFLMPEAYKARDRLIGSIQQWHSHARENFRPSDINLEDGTDPFWGTELIRSRQKKMLGVDKMGHEAMAIVDFGLIWGTLSNVVPSSMMTSLYTFRDPRLRDAIRDTLADVSLGTLKESGVKKLTKKTLLCSVYAETLRLHVQAIIARSSPHNDIQLESWWIPRTRMCIVNTYASHMDSDFWNTREGKFPVEKFWAERFVIDPKDPTSGPVRGDIPESIYKRPRGPSGQGDDEAFFSLEGLRASWIPYGGGYVACPGRELAKSLILYMTAVMLQSFDVEILSKELRMDWSKFGLGAQSPKHSIPFRIRRRKVE